MRKLTIATTALLLLPTLAHAFDWSEDKTRYLSDPSYLPAKGELDGESSLYYKSSGYDISYSDGSPPTSQRTKSYRGSQSFTYGLTRRIAIGVTESYQHADRTVDSSNGQSKLVFSGLEDPTIHLRGRLIPQSFSPVYVDPYAAYSPDLLADKAANKSTNGTVAQGGQIFTMGLYAGREMKSLTTELGFLSQYEGSRSVDYSNGNTGTISSRWTLSLNWNNQIRWTDSIFTNAGLSYSHTEGADYTTPNSLPFSMASYPSYSLHVSPGVVLVPNRLTLTTELKYSKDGSITKTSSDASTSQLKSNGEYYFGLHLRYKIM